MVGVVADTHGVLHPGVGAALGGVARIVHAGDVGGRAVLDALALIAPVDAVRGNVDTEGPAARLPAERVVDIGGRRLLVVHALGDPARLDAATWARLFRLSVDVVCFGHSHRALVRRERGVLFVNPGGAGRKRFALPRSVARLDLTSEEPSGEIVPLDPP